MMGERQRPIQGRMDKLQQECTILYDVQMQRTFTVTANWDAEARVFTSQSDIPGLVIEAETFEELVDLVEALAPEMIAANVPDAARPYIVKVETRRELAVA